MTQFIAHNKTRGLISLLTRSETALCQLNPVQTTALYFISILLSHLSLSFVSGLKFFIQLKVRALCLAHLMYFYFITFRVINRTIAKENTVQISAVPTSCHVIFCVCKIETEMLGRRGGKYIKMNLSEIDSTSGFLKIECNAQDG